MENKDIEKKNPSSEDISSPTKSHYENPNYRKLYAKISMEQMIGVEGGLDSKISKEDIEKDVKEDDEEEEDILNTTVESNDSDQKFREHSQNDLDFYYDDYEDYYEEEDEDEEEEDEEDEEEVENEDSKLLTSNEKDGNTLKSSSTVMSDNDLPDGWERHEDELGPYFWHIPTGTIQRERPFLDTIDKSMIRSDSLVFLDKSAINVDYNPNDSELIEELDEDLGDGALKTSANTSNESGSGGKTHLISKKKVIANLRLTFPTDDEEDDEDQEDEEDDVQNLSFVVHSLGWLEVDESQINSKTGSMVIKRCIYELSNGSNESATKCWGLGDTQSLTLRLSPDKICLLDPQTETILSIQLIREIRMWAVDDQNNFAYVVKERSANNTPNVPTTSSMITSPLDITQSSSKLKCHVFHCDSNENQKIFSAQKIAIYLKDALVRIRNYHQHGHQRPTSLFSNGGKRKFLKNRIVNSDSLNSYEFPTPIEEPRKSIEAYYMGYSQVAKPMGVDILNFAIEDVSNSLKMSMTAENSNELELMRPVVVHVSPSNIVVECQGSGATLLECRVRYLSFLGISLDDVKRCGLIVQVDEKQFIAHCFQCEPSAGALCKTVEAACKLRYQKCLDAHARMKQQNQQQQQNQQNPKQHRYRQLNQHSNGNSHSTISHSKSSPTVAAIKSTIAGVFSKILNK